MTRRTKLVEHLTAADLDEHPVWEFLNDDELDETAVRPVKKLPVDSLGNRVVGTKVVLANGKRVWATVCNVEVRDPTATEHFITLSLMRRGKWFTLSRYHDVDYLDNGPDGLASFLGLGVDEVFPISYDIRAHVVGDAAALVGQISKVPHVQLSEAQLITMAVPR